MRLSFVKTITVCQPYAELIARGEKRVENRVWAPKYRGPIAIHAGMSRDWLDTYDPLPNNLVYGAVVAIANLVTVVHVASKSDGRIDAWLKAGMEEQFGWLRDHEHFTGPWGWILSDIRRVGPFPARGMQNLWSWRVPPDHQSEVAAAIRVRKERITRWA